MKERILRVLVRRAKDLPDSIKLQLDQTTLSENRLVKITIMPNSPIIEPKIEVLKTNSFSDNLLEIAKRDGVNSTDFRK
jgi:hypothetical protein